MKCLEGKEDIFGSSKSSCLLYNRMPRPQLERLLKQNGLMGSSTAQPHLFFPELLDKLYREMERAQAHALKANVKKAMLSAEWQIQIDPVPQCVASGAVGRKGAANSKEMSNGETQISASNAVTAGPETGATPKKKSEAPSSAAAAPAELAEMVEPSAADVNPTGPREASGDENVGLTIETSAKPPTSIWSEKSVAQQEIKGDDLLPDKVEAVGDEEYAQRLYPRACHAM